MDERKRSQNIDSQGHVFFLDQELLDRKEVGYPPYKNRPDGLGIWNWILKNVLYMSDKRWPLALKLYRMFVKYSVWMKQGGWKARLYKKAIRIYPDKERPTGTIVMPLNIDITDQTEKTIVTLDMIKRSLKDVDYIAGMDHCLCREAQRTDIRICDRRTERSEIRCRKSKETESAGKDMGTFAEGADH